MYLFRLYVNFNVASEEISSAIFLQGVCIAQADLFIKSWSGRKESRLRILRHNKRTLHRLKLSKCNGHPLTAWPHVCIPQKENESISTYGGGGVVLASKSAMERSCSQRSAMRKAAQVSGNTNAAVAVWWLQRGRNKGAGVVNVSDKLKECTLRWLGHVVKKYEINLFKRMWDLEVGWRRPRGLLKSRWIYET